MSKPTEPNENASDTPETEPVSVWDLLHALTARVDAIERNLGNVPKLHETTG